MAREQRRLAAILAADVVGYSRLMGRDEAGTLARLKAHRTERFEPALTRNGGRLVKLTGDGALAEFGSAVDALRTAIEFQQAMVDANRDQPEDTRVVFRLSRSTFAGISSTMLAKWPSGADHEELAADSDLSCLARQPRNSTKRRSYRSFSWVCEVCRPQRVSCAGNGSGEVPTHKIVRRDAMQRRGGQNAV